MPTHAAQAARPTALQLLNRDYPDEAGHALAARVNGQCIGLLETLPEQAILSPITLAHAEAQPILCQLGRFLLELTLHQCCPHVRMTLAVPTLTGYRCDLCGELNPATLERITRHIRTLIALNIPILPSPIPAHARTYCHGHFRTQTTWPLPLSTGTFPFHLQLEQLSQRHTTTHILMTLRQS